MRDGALHALNLLLRWQTPPGAETETDCDDAAEAIWRGVGFDLGSRHLVAPLGQVAEITICATAAPLPRTPAWVRGLVSVHGKGLAVIDLNAFLGAEPLATVDGARLLVMRSTGLQAALVVERVHGLLRFPASARQAASGQAGTGAERYVTASFGGGAERWSGFDLRRLAADERFRRAGRAGSDAPAARYAA